MSKLNQRQAVYVTTMNVLADHSIPFDDGQKPTADELVTKEMRAVIIGILTEGFLKGEIEMSADASAKYDDVKKMKGYVSGLVSNWFRKDPRLNGDMKYETQNPGSRTGVTDEQIKALKALRDLKAGDAEAVAAIDKAIEARKLELKPKTATITEAQLSLIPAELRAKLGI